MAEKLVVLEEFVITTHLRFQSPYGDLESGDQIPLTGAALETLGFSPLTGI